MTAKLDDVATLRRWARTSLGLGGDASLQDARGHLLARLADEEFVPPDSWHEAAWVLEDEALGIATTRPPASYVQERRAKFAAEIDAFAAEFFDLTPADRQVRWQLLRDRADQASHAARLELLKPGLALEAEQLDISSSAFHSILLGIRELFVLSPPQQAQRRRSLVAEMDYDARSVDQALQLLDLHCPHWLAIGSEFLKAIANKYPESPIDVSDHDSTYSVVAACWSNNTAGAGTTEVYADYQQRWSPPVSESYARATAHRSPNRGGADSGWWRWLAIPLVVMICRLAMVGTNVSSRYNNNSSPPWQPGQYPRGPQDIPGLPRLPPQKISLPTDAEGNIELQVDPNKVQSDEAKEALSRILGIPNDKLKLAPRRKDPTPSPASEDEP